MTIAYEVPAVGTKVISLPRPSHVARISGDLIHVALDVHWGNVVTNAYKWVEGRGWCYAFLVNRNWVVLKSCKPLVFGE